MKIILEGPDNAGKTSLAQLLMKELGGSISYHHPGGKPDSLQVEIECIDQQMEWLSAPGNAIIDRITPISQMVYNPEPLMNKMRLQALNHMMNHDPLIIYCRPSTDRLLRIQDLTWREGETEEHKQKIIRGQHGFVMAYDHLMRTVRHVGYNFEDVIASESLVRNVIDACRGSDTAKSQIKTLIDWSF